MSDVPDSDESAPADEPVQQSLLPGVVPEVEGEPGVINDGTFWGFSSNPEHPNQVLDLMGPPRSELIVVPARGEFEPFIKVALTGDQITRSELVPSVRDALDRFFSGPQEQEPYMFPDGTKGKIAPAGWRALVSEFWSRYSLGDDYLNPPRLTLRKQKRHAMTDMFVGSNGETKPVRFPNNAIMRLAPHSLSNSSAWTNDPGQAPVYRTKEVAFGFGRPGDDGVISPQEAAAAAEFVQTRLSPKIMADFILLAAAYVDQVHRAEINAAGEAVISANALLVARGHAPHDDGSFSVELKRNIMEEIVNGCGRLTISDFVDFVTPEGALHRVRGPLMVAGGRELAKNKEAYAAGDFEQAVLVRPGPGMQPIFLETQFVDFTRAHMRLSKPRNPQDPLLGFRVAHYVHGLWRFRESRNQSDQDFRIKTIFEQIREQIPVQRKERSRLRQRFENEMDRVVEERVFDSWSYAVADSAEAETVANAVANMTFDDWINVNIRIEPPGYTRARAEVRKAKAEAAKRAEREKQAAAQRRALKRAAKNKR